MLELTATSALRCSGSPLFFPDQIGLTISITKRQRSWQGSVMLASQGSDRAEHLQQRGGKDDGFIEEDVMMSGIDAGDECRADQISDAWYKVG